MTAGILWPIAFGFVGSLAIVLSYVQKSKAPTSGNPKDIKRIDIKLESHEKDLKEGTEKISAVSTKIELVSQTVGFIKETQGRMDRCLQKQTETIQEIQLEIPKMTDKFRGNIKESVENVFDEKIKELKALAYGKKTKD